MNVTGRFDLTDELMRFSKQDPYRYEKARFLALTREMRIERAATNHAANLRRATGDLPLLLERIACDLGLMRRERVAIIQKLRDDLDLETPEGEAAAQRIDQFLQVLAGRFAAPLTKDGCTAPPKNP